MGKNYVFTVTSHDSSRQKTNEIFMSLEEARRNQRIFYSIQFENSVGRRFSDALTINRVVVKLGITRYSHIWRFVNFPAVVSRRRSNLETPHFSLCALIHVTPSTRHLCADAVRGRVCFENRATLGQNINSLFRVRKRSPDTSRDPQIRLVELVDQIFSNIQQYLIC